MKRRCDGCDEPLSYTTPFFRVSHIRYGQYREKSSSKYTFCESCWARFEKNAFVNEEITPQYTYNPVFVRSE